MRKILAVMGSLAYFEEPETWQPFKIFFVTKACVGSLMYMFKTLCTKLIADMCDAIELGEYLIMKRYPMKLQASITELSTKFDHI